MELKKEKLPEALALLQSDARLFLPAEADGLPQFTVWDGKQAPCLSGNPPLPPKDVLFPRSEKMYGYNLSTGDVADLASPEKQVIFGIRPCDVKSIEKLDRAFLEKGYADSYYRTRREQLTTLSLGCTEAARTCFCESMGLDPADAPGADLMLNDAGDAFSVKSNSEKGEAVLARWGKLLTEDADKDAKGAGKDVSVHCAFKVDLPADLPERLTARFEDPAWAALSRACLGCGCCSYICPTCYCFDIGQENRGAEGTAFRCWDSCMFSDYSRMAGGHNPRPSKRERLRNRYLHKLAYFNERYGTTLCVGCGRCVDKCPAHLDITKVIETVGGER
ncbi:MAG: 4Fe-4S dicluster domain-containing protein [Clostridiales Family XIII bacterium]|jgi:ferredoxin|nr:4Fe-4S dicluster domain-containing protein [Clostridiales Family XIII bacterium]